MRSIYKNPKLGNERSLGECNLSIFILIFNILRQMRYCWNRDHSYIVNIIVSLNDLGLN